MPNCKTIAICNQKGGVGKTTMAFSTCSITSLGKRMDLFVVAGILGILNLLIIHLKCYSALSVLHYALQIYVAFVARLCYDINGVRVLEDSETELYKAMYYKLFNAISDSMSVPVALLRNQMLRKAQEETEEMYMAFQDRQA